MHLIWARPVVSDLGYKGGKFPDFGRIEVEVLYSLEQRCFKSNLERGMANLQFSASGARAVYGSLMRTEIFQYLVSFDLEY